MKIHICKFLILIGFLLVFESCGESTSSGDSKRILMETDKAFSDYCLQNGMNKAFYKYASEKAVMLKDNRFPLIGKENIKKQFSGDDTQVTFSWRPLNADVSKSGELGYSYGTYTYQTLDSLYEGTYVSVWKKDKNGDWKYVLDSGNEGLGK